MGPRVREDDTVLRGCPSGKSILDGFEAQRLVRCRDTGAIQPVPEESTYKPLNQSRGECRAVSAEPVV